MRFSKILISVAGALLLASPAFAAADPLNDWTVCSEDLTDWKEVSLDRPSNQSKICFEFDETIDESGVINTTFTVVTGHASFCTSHDVRGLIGAMELILYTCPTNFPATANTCEEQIFDTFTTDRCEAITNGTYAIDITIDPDVGEDSVVAVEGY